MSHTFKNKKEELDSKTQRLKVLYTKFQSAKVEIRDLQDEFYREREDMMDTIRDLIMRVKLKNLLIEHFVPENEVTKIDAILLLSKQWQPLSKSACACKSCRTSTGS